MSTTTNSDSNSDGYSAMDTTDLDAVVRQMLLENTGRSLLDSGDAYGRHWEENQHDPPWEKPRLNVYDGWVTMNVYHYLTTPDRLERDEQAVALERIFYDKFLEEIDASRPGLPEMKDFPEWLDMNARRYVGSDDLDEDWEMAARFVLDHQTSWNTYNSEHAQPSQTLQGVTVNPESDFRFSMIQVHQGCDVRGGYTVPRFFKHEWNMFPMQVEFHFACTECDWSEAESVLSSKVYGDDEDGVPEFDEEENEIYCPKCAIPEEETPDGEPAFRGHEVSVM